MKRALMLLGVLTGLAVLFVVSLIWLTPWMDRWGATEAEIRTSFPGDELVPEPVSFVNRAITIHASPEQIYPWLVQLGAGKGGWYSYSWFETHALRCPLVNADRIHTEWQDLQVGDEVKMCPGEFGPPPYQVAQIVPNEAIVLGHQENGQWVNLWQLVLLPQADGSTRLIQRTRTMMAGGLWSIIHPGVFIMERGMILGIKESAESITLAEWPSPTPTPEVFIPLNPSPTPSNSDLPLTCQMTDLSVFIDRQAGYCFAFPTRFALSEQHSTAPVVLGSALGSPDEQVRATFTVEQALFDPDKSLDQQVDEFLSGFTVLDPNTFTRARLVVGGEAALLVDAVPVQLSWRIIFVPHNGVMYRLMYWPVDVPEAQVDLEELYQSTLGSFSFID
jgi:hypothetical protein